MSSTNEERQRIAEKLRAAREMAGLSQGQVARLLNLHRPTVSEIEAGRRRISAEEINRFSEIYGISVTWLLGEENPERETYRAKVELAARHLSKLKPEDLERVIDLLSALRTSEAGDDSGT